MLKSLLLCSGHPSGAETSCCHHQQKNVDNTIRPDHHHHHHHQQRPPHCPQPNCDQPVVPRCFAAAADPTATNRSTSPSAPSANMLNRARQQQLQLAATTTELSSNKRPNKRIHRRKSAATPAPAAAFPVAPAAVVASAASGQQRRDIGRSLAMVGNYLLVATAVWLLAAASGGGGDAGGSGGVGLWRTVGAVAVEAAQVAGHRCASDASCQNGGRCRNGTCSCAEGWQGDECQFCGGKVRLTDKHGYISDGAGNYSVGVKCSWLIDARDRRPNQLIPPSAVGSKSDGAPSISSTSASTSSASAASSGSVLAASNKNAPAVRQPSIRLHLEEFATECGWDHLYVYDGDSVESPLLAVFSGLMYRQNLSIRRVPEVVAHSGSVLLHFFSDDAYNMSGFNISYTVNGCPTSEARHNCSGHGVCVDGTCTCDADYMGAACNQPKCAGNCSWSLGQGECDRQAHRCSCATGFAGNDCTQPTAAGFWSIVTPDFPPPPGSASHGSAVWRDTLHIIGGESYGQAQPLYTYDFNGNVWETVHSRGTGAHQSLIPRPRFGASTVMYGDKIVMYGGVIRGGGGASGNSSSSGADADADRLAAGVCDELWAFDVSARTWENITVRSGDVCNRTHEMCGPLRVAGHTATLVPTWDDSSAARTQKMFAIFGHSPQFGFLNTVQEYSFGTREWRIVPTVGYPVKGGYGHSAAYDQLTERIYVYGGIVSENENAQLISARLYSYEPRSRLWRLLSAAGSVRFLHTATFVSPGLMMVFGGNTHNDTSHSYGAKCYSRDLLVYDVLCDAWHTQAIPTALRADLARFGHSAAMFEGSLYIFGGFDGQMLADQLRYTPGTCAPLQRADACLQARPGRKCVWDVALARCRAVGELGAEVLQQFAAGGATGGGGGGGGGGDAAANNQHDSQQLYQLCPGRSRHAMTQQLLQDVERCAELGDCQSCTATAFGCTWCATGVCAKDKCRENHVLDSHHHNSQHSFSAAAAAAAAAASAGTAPTATTANGNQLLLAAISAHAAHAQPPATASPITAWERCPPDASPQCAQLHGCHACVAHSQCHWDYEHSRCRLQAAGNRTAGPGGGSSSSAGDEQLPCPQPCSALRTCANCTADECIWCQNEQRCVDKNAYTASFPYGQCREWTTQPGKCRAPPADGRSPCGYYRTCAQCRDDPACGWCDDGSETGLGVCLPGGDGGAQDEMDAGCPLARWFFTHCPQCQCNGHSWCESASSTAGSVGVVGPGEMAVVVAGADDVTTGGDGGGAADDGGDGGEARVCQQPCQNLTMGANCERCRPGYWGNPVNGGTCQRCECNGQAAHCHHETAKCYCSTKGLAGDHCEKCDATNHYHGDPAKGSCYYDLTIDYQFTFNLSKKEDRHFTQINFRNSPVKADIDADFTISCSVAAKMNVTVRTLGGPEKPMFSNINCSNFRYRFPKTEHRFGIGVENVTATTFYVYVYDFQPPLWIQIAFSQYPKLNLQQFFITFSSCFLLLLLLAAFLWKMKQRYDLWRRRQRMWVEMEQMASRPSVRLCVEIESREADELLSAAPVSAPDGATSGTKKRKKDPTSPIALEPCYGQRAAVLSLLVRLPTGGLEYSPAGQAAGLAVASALVTLGTPPSLDTFPKEPKAKRKQSQHPDNCI